MSTSAPSTPSLPWGYDSGVDDSVRKERGQRGEEIAAEFLRRKGFQIIGRNYRKPWGEIDLIAIKSETVRFIEVKAVSREMGRADVTREMDYRPEELVHTAKLRKVARTAALYMEEKKDEREYQIDVVGVIMDERKRVAKCRLFEQVLDGEI